MVQRKGPITGNIHVKYQSSSTHCLKGIENKLKVFKKWVKLKGQGHRVKNNGPHGKALSQEILVKYQSSSTHFSQFFSKVKVFVLKMGQTTRSRSQGQK